MTQPDIYTLHLPSDARDVTLPFRQPMSLTKESKCDDCIIGTSVQESEYEDYKDYRMGRYTFCPKCGHKIDWEKISGKV